jgi:hypothetical protein
MLRRVKPNYERLFNTLSRETIDLFFVKLIILVLKSPANSFFVCYFGKNFIAVKFYSGVYIETIWNSDIAIFRHFASLILIMFSEFR